MSVDDLRSAGITRVRVHYSDHLGTTRAQVIPLDLVEEAVAGLGPPFICANQQYAPSQWEINCRYNDALAAADEAHLLKLVVKEIAAMHGLVATFMGRPGEAGGTP